jgi:hypothetical protein
MDYGMIGKIEKARRYAEEPHRISLHTLEVEFRGDNDTYIINLTEAGWHCSCSGFAAHGLCPHIMTLEKVFKPMLKRPAMPYGHGQNVVSDVEKSTRYSHEKDRIQVLAFTAAFEGSNDSHDLSYSNGEWNCTCDFFHSRHVCCHTMALERILAGMIPTPAQPALAH